MIGSNFIPIRLDALLLMRSPDHVPLFYLDRDDDSLRELNKIEVDWVQKSKGN